MLELVCAADLWGWPMSGQGQWRAFRWVMVAVSAAIAALLLARADYVIGGLIAVLVVLRVVFLLGTSRARRVSRSRRVAKSTGQRADSSAAVRRVLRGLARSEFKVAASVIGIDTPEMRRAFNQGRSIAELARARDVPLDQVVNAIMADSAAQIDTQVAQRSLDPQTAARAKSRLSFWASRLVDFHKGDFSRVRNEAPLRG